MATTLIRIRQDMVFMIGALDVKEKARLTFHFLRSCVKDVVELGATLIRTQQDLVFMIGAMDVAVQDTPGDKPIVKAKK